MIEIKVTVEVLGVVDAINNLASAIAGKNTAVAEKHEAETPKAAMVAPAEIPVQPDVVALAPEAPAPVTAMPVVEAKPEEATPAKQEAAAPTVTMHDVSIAGAKLVDAGKMDAVVNVLKDFGVCAVTQLKEEQLSAFAMRLRDLGADI